jgi:hypothetical protein
MFTEKTFAIIDTETLGGAAQALCPTYHCAGIALTKRAEINRINIVVIGNLLLDSAFYGKTKKDYYRDLLRDPATVICYNEAEAKEAFSAWLSANNVECVCAHNSGFDFHKTFVSECVEGMEFIDTWQAFFETIGKYRKYNKFCCENGFVTKSGNIQMTAEVCYRFISGNVDFVEEHTALADCEIEADILRAVWATHRKFTRNVHKGDSPHRFAVVKGRF